MLSPETCSLAWCAANFECVQLSMTGCSTSGSVQPVFAQFVELQLSISFLYVQHVFHLEPQSPDVTRGHSLDHGSTVLEASYSAPCACEQHGSGDGAISKNILVSYKMRNQLLSQALPLQADLRTRRG